MASRPDSEELKRQAKNTLAEGRVEMAVETRRLRTQLNPKLAVHRAFDKHTGGAISAAFAGGVLIAFLLFRDRNHARSGTRVQIERQTVEPPKKSNGGFLGMLARTAAPLLVKHVLGKPLEQLLARKNAETFPAV